MDGFGAVTAEQREVMHLARRARLDHQASLGAQAFADQVLVDRGSREQRRNRDAVAVELAVAEYQHIKAAVHGIDRARAERGDAGFDAVRAPGHRVGDVELVAAELVVRRQRDAADEGHFRAVEHRLRDFEAQRRVDVIDVEQVGLGADERHQRHDHLLADRIDRRVGHLREELAEVVVEGLRAIRQDGQRRIVAHRADGFLARGGHGLKDELVVFLRPAEGLLAVEQRERGAVGADGDIRGRGQRIELHAQAFDPLAVGVRVGKLRLDLGIVDDATLLKIDQQHLAWLQAPFLDDAAFRDGQRARFGGHDHHVVVGDQVARGAQSVAVERSADLAAIGERDRGGAVPRLHHRGVVFVEGPAARVHVRVLLPGFGNHHHHGVRGGVARHHEQLKAVVERGGI